MKATILFTLCLLLFAPCVANSQTAQTDDGSAEYTQSQKHYYQPETRLSLLKTAIEKGNSDALVDMGNIYYNGYANIKKGNYAEAQKYWSKAADLGNPHGYFNIGLLYRHGYGVEKDVNKAISYWTQSADLGNPRGYYNIGLLYLYGNEVKKDINKAISYWTQSADLGNPHAMEALGNLYFDKKALPRDVENAYLWFKKAVDNGVTKAIPAMLTAEIMVEAEKTLKKPNATDFEKGVAYFELKKKKEAVMWLKKAAKTGNSKAMVALGLGIKEWGYGRYDTKKEAAGWFKKAAKKGNEKGMYLIGNMYEKGEMNLYQKADYVKAMKWYKKAGEKDDIDALLTMGWLYHNGYKRKYKKAKINSTKPNADYRPSISEAYNAYPMFEKVAELGHPEGYFNMGYMIEQGYRGAKNSKKYGYAGAEEFYQKAADMGHEEAEAALDRYYRYYEYNIGVDHFNRRQYAEAIEMFEAAYKKDSKDPRAVKYLAQIYEKGLGVEQNKKTAFKYYLRAADLGDRSSRYRVVQLYDKDPKYQSAVALHSQSISTEHKEAMARQVAEARKSRQEADAYHQQQLGRGQVSGGSSTGSSWQGFSYSSQTTQRYNRTVSEGNARRQTENYKRWLDYKFGK